MISAMIPKWVNWDAPLPAINVSHDDLMVILGVMLVLVLVQRNAFPSIDSIERFMRLLHTPGGNLAILGFLTWWFYLGALRMFYRILDMIKYHELTPDNATLQLGIGFVTAGSFGLVAGALIKSLSAESDRTTRSTDPTSINGTARYGGSPPVQLP